MFLGMPYVQMICAYDIRCALLVQYFKIKHVIRIAAESGSSTETMHFSFHLHGCGTTQRLSDRSKEGFAAGARLASP